jgi:positive regulator of sigma E activity
MTKYFKFFEVAYLVIAIVFVVETFLNWNTQREKAYLYLVFSLLAIFMYFFRRKYRKKFENKDNYKK